MVPKIHKKGRSFKGAAAYLLHDKDAQTNDRVAWTETRNLAVDEPDHAWRVMAATAMDQQRLKDQAGIKSTGRKSNLSVLHFTLAWHPEEADGLSRDEMMRAAIGALKALGADDRQAMIIAHSDEAHPHVHCLVNRVSPEDGRMLSSSKEKLALSRWAETYEKDRGKIYCEERVLNNEARLRGEYTRAARAKSRNVYEAEQQAAVNDNDASAALAFAQEKQRAATATLGKRTRAIRDGYAERADALAKQLDDTKRSARADLRRQLSSIKDQVRQEFREDRRALLHERDQAEVQFEANRESAKGKLSNRIDGAYRAFMDSDRGMRGALSAVGNFFADEGRQRQLLAEEHERKRRALSRAEAEAYSKAAGPLREDTNHAIKTAEDRFLELKKKLQDRFDRAEGLLKERWRSRGQANRQAMAPFTDPAQQPVQRVGDHPRRDEANLTGSFNDKSAKPASEKGSGDDDRAARKASYMAKKAAERGALADQDQSIGDHPRALPQDASKEERKKRYLLDKERQRQETKKRDDQEPGR